MSEDKDKPTKAKKEGKKPAAGAEGGAEAAAPKAKKKGKEGSKGATNAFIVAAKGTTRISPTSTPRLMTDYSKRIVPALVKEFQLKNAMEVPRLEKIVINCASKDAVGNPKVLDFVLNDIALITGQKPVLTRARKSIANFKVRQGIPLGAFVTLRRARMYEFLDRLVNIALPRVRDFRGISPKSFDGRGNYSLGIREQIIFPEIDYDKVDKVRGLTITIATSAKNNEHARALLREFGMPFRK